MTKPQGAPVVVTVLLLALACAAQVLAHEEGEGGKSKAVTATSPEEGFQLTALAVKTLGLRFSKLQAASGEGLTVPSKALVYFQAEVGVYRKRGAWLKLVEVEVAKKTANEARIESREIKEGDEIVTEGVPLLRVADLQRGGGEADHD